MIQTHSAFWFLIAPFDAPILSTSTNFLKRVRVTGAQLDMWDKVQC